LVTTLPTSQVFRDERGFPGVSGGREGVGRIRGREDR
jgi:hypothetical protein